MDITLQPVSLQANGATTSDWIGQVKNRVIYAYDVSALISESKENAEFTKTDFERDLRKVSQRRKLPFGENIRDTIRDIRGK